MFCTSKVGRGEEIAGVFGSPHSLISFRSDVVGLDTTENKAILGECKFRNTPMDKKQLEELMDRDGLIDKRYKVAEYHLYSLSGFTDWVKDNAVALNVRLIPIEDMYN